MEIETFTLPNGLRFVHKRVKAAAACCGITVNAGTRDELEHEHGLAHFLEHMLFKGTTRRTAMHINTFLENRGGDLNAFTTKEETGIQAVALRNDLEKMFDIMADIVFNSTFPPNEIAKEKDVVRDEINMCRDNPIDLLFDEFEELLFPNTSLGRSILGTPKSLRRFSQKKVQEFRQRCYTTNNMVFSSVGSFGADRVETLARRHFAQAASANVAPVRLPVPDYTPFAKTGKHATKQALCLLGNRTFGYASPQRYALALLTNMLGGPSQNSLLNIALREAHGLAYNVEVAATLYSDCGATTIYFGTEKSSVDRCLQLVNVELDKLRNHPLSTVQLRRTQRQLLGQLAIASDSNEQTMLSIGKSMLSYGRVDSNKEIREHILAISAEQLQTLACEVFDPKAMSSLMYV